MTVSQTISNKYISPWFLHESKKREELARFFLHNSSKRSQNSPIYKTALRNLCDVEIKSIIGYEGKRALRHGNVSLLLKNTLEAISVTMQPHGKNLNYRIDERAYYMSVDCRLLQLCITKIISKCFERQITLNVQVKTSTSQLAIVVETKGFIKDRQTLSLLKSVLHLHKGTLVVTNNRIAFSFNSRLPNQAGEFEPPSIDELIHDPVSYINIALA